MIEHWLCINGVKTKSYKLKLPYDIEYMNAMHSTAEFVLKKYNKNKEILKCFLYADKAYFGFNGFHYAESFLTLFVSEFTLRFARTFPKRDHLFNGIRHFVSEDLLKNHARAYAEEMYLLATADTVGHKQLALLPMTPIPFDKLPKCFREGLEINVST